jgi:hypothetical protein
MILISRIFKKFLKLFSKVSRSKPESEAQEHIGGIFVELTPEFEFDIACLLPSLDKFNDQQLLEVAEKYAELLLLLNKGFLKKQIFTMLNNYVSNNDDIKSKLLVDNIVAFYDILNNELNNTIKANANKPIVKPTSVFQN